MSAGLRPIRIEAGLAFVLLTRGLQAVIAAEDVPLVEGYNWFAAARGKHVYAGRSLWLGGPKPNRLILMHRVLMGDPEGMLVDHVDGDGLNNVRSNLRVAVMAQNLHNTGRHRDNKSGFKGVHEQRPGRWVAYIMAFGRKEYLGIHDTPDAAHAAYCEASLRLHGEFSRSA
jgi:hypothetical protein